MCCVKRVRFVHHLLFLEEQSGRNRTLSFSRPSFDYLDGLSVPDVLLFPDNIIPWLVTTKIDILESRHDSLSSDLVANKFSNVLQAEANNIFSALHLP